MTPQELRDWRTGQGWTLDDAAYYLGTTKTSVHRWEAGKYPIPQTIETLTLLLRDTINKRRVDKKLRNTLD
jgi:transcriptional regulator with XRE-family HTH domain